MPYTDKLEAAINLLSNGFDSDNRIIIEKYPIKDVSDYYESGWKLIEHFKIYGTHPTIVIGYFYLFRKTAV